MTLNLSVIILTGSDASQADGAVASVTDQELPGEMEILLIRVGWGGPARSEFRSGAKIRHVPVAEPESFGKVRAQAVRACDAPLVAFLEDHCQAAPGWAEALLDAHRGPWAGVGCEVHNGNAGQGISDAVALMNYAPWLPPAEAGETDMLIGHNASYKRQLLLDYGEQLEPLLRSDSALNMKLVDDGHRLYVEPRAKIAHANEHDLRSILEGYFLLNRSLAATRAQVFEWTAFERAWRSLLWPAVPLRRSARLLGYLRRARPDLVGQALGWLPVMLAAWTATGLGQALGVLLGPGSSDRDFLLYEITPRKSVQAQPSGTTSETGQAL